MTSESLFSANDTTILRVDSTNPEMKVNTRAIANGSGEKNLNSIEPGKEQEKRRKGIRTVLLSRHPGSFAISVLLFFFLYPVNMANLISQDFSGRKLMSAEALLVQKQSTIREFVRFAGTKNTEGAGEFYSILAVILAISTFSYLFDQRKTDFWHGLPVKRGKLYRTNVLNSFLISAVPALVMSALSALIVSTQTGRAGYLVLTALEGTVLHLIAFSAVYMTTMLAVMLTGNIIVSLLGTAVFFSIVPAVIGLYPTLCQSFFTHWYSRLPEALVRTLQLSSPVLLDKAIRFDEKPAPLAMRLAVALVLAVVLYFVNQWIYKKRPSEAAGHAMAFQKTETPIEAVLVIVCALYMASFLHSLYGGTTGTLWSVFGFVAALLLSHAVISCIYDADVRAAFRHPKRLLLEAVAGGGIFLVFLFDLTGFDRYIPSASDVASYGISSPYLAANQVQYTDISDIYTDQYDNAYAGTSQLEDRILQRMQIADVEDSITLAREALTDSDLSSERSYNTTYVNLCWHLKNGRDVYRTYTVDIDTNREALRHIYDDEAYKKTEYPVLSMMPEELSGVNACLTGDTTHVNFASDAEMKTLLTTYQKELLALPAEECEKTNPVMTLQFKSKAFQAAYDAAPEDGKSPYYTMSFYPVYPCMKETLALLKEKGFDPMALLDPENVKSISVDVNLYDLPDGAFSFDAMKAAGYTVDAAEIVSRTVTDPAEIKEIMAVATGKWCDLNINLMLQQDYAYVVNVNYKEDVAKLAGEKSAYDGSNVLNFTFPQGAVPDFLKVS